MIVALGSQRGGWPACGPPEGEGPQWPPPLAALSERCAGNVTSWEPDARAYLLP